MANHFVSLFTGFFFNQLSMTQQHRFYNSLLSILLESYFLLILLVKLNQLFPLLCLQVLNHFIHIPIFPPFVYGKIFFLIFFVSIFFPDYNKVLLLSKLFRSSNPYEVNLQHFSTNPITSSSMFRRGFLIIQIFDLSILDLMILLV